MGPIAAVQLSHETRDRLAELTQSPRVTDDEVVNKLPALVPRGDDEGRYPAAFRVGLLNTDLDIRSRRTVRYPKLKRTPQGRGLRG
jgi:hypothetical protein